MSKADLNVQITLAAAWSLTGRARDTAGVQRLGRQHLAGLTCRTMEGEASRKGGVSRALGVDPGTRIENRKVCRAQ